MTLTSRSDFLKFVSDRESFDTQLASYIQTTFIQEQYVLLPQLLCSRVSRLLTHPIGFKPA